MEQLADRALRQLRAQLATRVRSELDRIGYVHRLQAITNSDPQQLDAAVREAVGPAVSRLGPRMRELVMQAQERLSCHRRAQAALALPLLAHLSLSHAYSQQHTCKLPLSHLFPTLVSLEVGRVSTQFDLFGHGVNNWEWRELLGSWPPGLQAPRVLHRAPLRVVQDAALDAGEWLAGRLYVCVLQGSVCAVFHESCMVCGRLKTCAQCADHGAN